MSKIEEGLTLRKNSRSRSSTFSLDNSIVDKILEVEKEIGDRDDNSFALAIRIFVKEGHYTSDEVIDALYSLGFESVADVYKENYTDKLSTVVEASDAGEREVAGDDESSD